MQATSGFDALIARQSGLRRGLQRGVRLRVPVIVAVNGSASGGIGLVGNADVIVASDDAVFGVPEVDRGALGAATHFARLLPST